MWFKDNRRILYRRGEQVWIVDSVTKRDKKIFSIAPDALNGRAVLAPDEKSIYFSLASVQSDIWMLSFE